MNKLAKRISAVVLAGAMTLSSSIAAFAADMTVYIRDNGKTIPATSTQSDETIPENIKLSFTIHNVDSSMSIYDALVDATVANKMLDPGVSLTTKWSHVNNSDGSDDYYLQTLSATSTNGHFAATNNGGNTRLDKDGDTIIGGKYEGNAWMWGWMKGDLTSTDYPGLTLSDQDCLDSNFAIILSYDYSSFEWKN